MSATSGSPTQLATSCDTPSDLAGTPDDAFRDGDLASVRSLWPNSTFRLRRTAPAVAPDNVTAISTYSGNGYWEVFGPSGAVLVFDTVADLAAFNDAAMPDGALVYVASIRSYWSKLVGANPGVVDNITNVRDPSNTATWLRDETRSPSWQSFSSWYIDPVSGNDENLGSTALAALKTWAEFVRRLSMVTRAVTVTILSNIAEPIRGTFTAISSSASLMITGQPTVLASGSASTFVDPVPAANTRGTVTVADLTTSGGAPTDFTPYVGKILRSPAVDGPNHFPVMRVAAGVAQGFYWSQDLNNTRPVNGTLVDVLDLITAPTAQVYGLGLPVRLRYFKYTSTATGDVPFIATLEPLAAFTTLVGVVLLGAHIACEFPSSIGGNPGGVTWVLGCLFRTSASGAAIISMGGSMNFLGGGSLRPLYANTPGKIRFQGFGFQGGGLYLGVTSSSTSGSGGGIDVESLSNTNPLGVFDAVDGITVANNAYFTTSIPYGSGSTGIGMRVSLGGSARITGTPTITGATELRFDENANAIPPLAAGAVVPAASALTTWAQWAAPPFNRYVVSYSTGSKIIGA